MKTTRWLFANVIKIILFLKKMIIGPDVRIQMCACCSVGVLNI